MVGKEELAVLVAETRTSAVQRIADIFTHPDDLHSKFIGIRKKIVAERSLIEAQLKTALDSQLEDANRGLDILSRSQQESEIVKNNLLSIQTLLNDAHHSIDNYAKIMQVHPFCFFYVKLFAYLITASHYYLHGRSPKLIKTLLLRETWCCSSKHSMLK